MNPLRKLIPTLLVLAIFTLSAGAQIISTNRKRPNDAPKTKSIHGIVQDQKGQPLEGARVFVRDTKANVTRTLTTDEKGAYSVNGLAPDVNYEVTADYKGQTAPGKKMISGSQDRADNLVSFEINVAISASSGADAARGIEIQTFDLVRLHASFDMPTGVQAPIPAVLLLHGYGEDSSVWDGFKKQLLSRGWAVMALDLRGHGQSTVKNNLPIRAVPAWRTSSNEFPQDIDPVLDWLKAQPRLDARRIVLVGFDVGANLALIASGKFPEVRTVVAVKPSLNESLSMAGSAQDFHPRSALIVVPDSAEGDRIKQQVKAPVRVQSLNVNGGAAQWFENKVLVDTIVQWLKETF
jgi:pimeloyl-ACP methyl ester carboxylesterase